MELMLMNERDYYNGKKICIGVYACVSDKDAIFTYHIIASDIVSDNDKPVLLDDTGFTDTIIFDDNLVSADLYQSSNTKIEYIKCIYIFDNHPITINFIPVQGTWVIDIPNDDEYKSLTDDDLMLDIVIYNEIHCSEDYNAICTFVIKTTVNYEPQYDKNIVSDESMFLS